jgi:hypothetical protein
MLGVTLRFAGRSNELEHGADLDSALEAARDRTEPGVERMHPLYVLAPVRRHGDPIMDPDALDNQHAILGLDLADRLDLVALRIDLDLTRLQRAGERARQSPSGGSHHVIECRGVRWILVRTHPVVLSHLGMHAEYDRLRLGREVR